MSPDIKGFIDKADRYLRSARILHREGDLDSAASRLYYSMFYCAEAMLLSKGLEFSSHRGVIATFGEKFVKGGRLSPDYHVWLRDAFDKRHFGDYRIPSGLEEKDIRLLEDRADRFIKVTRKMLESDDDNGLKIHEPQAGYRVGKAGRKTRKRKRPCAEASSRGTRVGCAGLMNWKARRAKRK